MDATTEVRPSLAARRPPSRSDMNSESELVSSSLPYVAPPARAPPSSSSATCHVAHSSLARSTSSNARSIDGESIEAHSVVISSHDTRTNGDADADAARADG